MILIYILLYIYLSTGFVWFGYLGMMHLKHNQDKITGEVKFFGTPWAIFYYLTDAIYNFTTGTLVFFEIPKEILFTARVSRHLRSKGYRGWMAERFCSKLLDPFEEGGHCERSK